MRTAFPAIKAGKTELIATRYGKLNPSHHEVTYEVRLVNLLPRNDNKDYANRFFPDITLKTRFVRIFERYV